MYKVVRCATDGVTEIELIGIMSPEDFKTYTYENFVSSKKGEYKAVFATKKEADKALALLAEYGSDIWLLGVNPETQEGETLVITTQKIEDIAA